MMVSEPSSVCASVEAEPLIGNAPSKCVVFFSGGLMSWAAAKRAAKRWGAENTTLLFTDTLIEDPDLYRFLDEAAENVGAPLVKIADGRTPWEVFRAEQIIGNQRIDPCSKILKRQPGERWLKENCDPADTVLIFGILWDEEHRLTSTYNGKPRGIRNRYKELGWPYVDATMCWAPWLSQQDVRAWAKLEGLKLPRLYDLGFSHNNCGGFCVKAGEGHFERLGSGWRVQHATCAIEMRGTPDPVRQQRDEARLRFRAKGTGRRAQRARKALRDREGVSV